MRFDVLTLFPAFFDSPLAQSITGKAIERGIIEVGLRNIRDYATDTHHTTDDSPYGGGSGMVMKVEPVVAAIEDVRQGDVRRDGKTSKVILATPQGKPLTHEMAEELAALDSAVIVCGRYEGVDERIRAFVDLEVSIGDYVLTGGEIPALVIMDAISRFVPGVLGGEDSAKTESFSPAAKGLLEYPQYTRPQEFRGVKVPEVLTSGNHKEIERWRLKKSIERTAKRRPERLFNACFTGEDKELLETVMTELAKKD